ncbi:hypothetical protein HX045_04350 [Myroides odoratimimus]|uniref:DUF6896 domain-containing protein n=3 Tax=Myroides TaxID=76831 RepID=A0A0U3H591_9FLAO|nr:MULTISPECIES: hypothetical protein [Myroides]AJA68734.1 hypothetical protein MYRA21_1581 [Myroides sp. A21]ALU25996.1 hypothetical protein AS202_07495 [Myroides odoratimimus]EHO11111.1 hypothetical protein HMPREF9712_00768 [Myroides odoratimimus CCUG 10230]EHO14248.1 hypothetical protein HMPREF9714_00510 [Myroides odoratimimus CCUG 12901]MCA4792569.1 hypothetical protein [Myroides odoratimimus]
MNDIKKYLNEYVRFIHEFEKVIRSSLNLVEEDIYQEIYKININSNGTKNYKHGNIDGYEYHYHGGGCFIQKGNIKCDFNFIRYIDDLTYQFTSIKLKDFIDSYYNIDIDDDKLNEKLKELVKEGFLLPVIFEGRVWDSFLIKRYS